MNILTLDNHFFSIPLITHFSDLDSFSFALHCFVNVKLPNLVYLCCLPLDLLMLHSFSIHYLIDRIHYSLIPSFPYLMFILSYLFILLTYLSVYPSCLSYLSFHLKQCYTLDSLH
jgi:hypothetical protein